MAPCCKNNHYFKFLLFFLNLAQSLSEITFCFLRNQALEQALGHRHEGNKEQNPQAIEKQMGIGHVPLNALGSGEVIDPLRAQHHRNTRRNTEHIFPGPGDG